MNITPINNNNNRPHFNGYLNLKVPVQSIHPLERFSFVSIIPPLVDGIAISQQTNRFSRFAAKMGLKTDAITFSHFPGCKWIADLISEFGRQKLQTKAYVRYNMDLELPKFDSEYFNFHILTGKEKKAYTDVSRFAADDIKAALSLKLYELTKQHKKLDMDDLYIMSKIAIYQREQEDFAHAVAGSNRVEIVAGSHAGIINSIKQILNS